MISRRSFVTSLSAAACACGLRKAHAGTNILAQISQSSSPVSSDITQLVKAKIGTGGHGHCFPGATVPFGMVQLGPDTYNHEWDWCSGYNYADDSIMGFSHTHLSGTGIGDMLDFLIMPCTGPVKTTPGTREKPETGYRSRFSHNDEVTEPGYYAVVLQDYKIRAELSATERAGIHRYTFPENSSSHFILDLDHGYSDGDGQSLVQWANVKLIGADTIVGGRSVAAWAKGREIYFAMKFSRPFGEVEILSGDQAVNATDREVKGKSLKCVLHYPTKNQEVIYVKTGISGVSAEGALQNLEHEIPDWNFERVRQEARARWKNELSKITIEGATRQQQEIFYTALYHTMLAPTLFDDVDGRYRGMDNEIHQLAAGTHNYSTFSLWDTYRALHPLFTLIQPERVPDFVNCLIRMAHESPVGMPVWPLQGKETQCMTGYHSAVVIAEAIQKKFPGIDVAGAYAAMKKQALVSDYQGLSLYRKHGYIPCDLVAESIGKSMDYAYNDWAVAHVVRAMGAEQDALALFQQAQNYRNLYDKQTGFIRPRLESGQWAEPFSLNEMGHSKQWRDYTESNPWQATFAVQHDPEGLATLMGGREKLREKLDGIFNASSEQPPDAPTDIAGLIGQYAHGNEPSHHIAYLYMYVGAPHATQERVRELLDTMYRNEPDGLAGNEDCGQMSAWYVISAIGFYAVDPVSANYVFGTPLFDKVTIRVGDGHNLTVQTVRQSATDKYIDALSLNGKPSSKLWFKHLDIARGGAFTLHMSAVPNKELGVSAKSAPPSMTSQRTS
jgi:predicted alpha-1,2-mannosidase